MYLYQIIQYSKEYVLICVCVCLCVFYLTTLSTAEFIHIAVVIDEMMSGITTAENRGNRRKLCPSTTLSTINPSTRTCLRSNPELCCEASD